MIFRLIYWLIWLEWKWRLLLIALLIIFIVIVVVPSAVCYSRGRKPANYSATPANATAMYLVSYDSGDVLLTDLTSEGYMMVATAATYIRPLM